MYYIESICKVLSFKFDCEGEYGMGPQGLGRVHVGVFPQVYLHLLYLECKYIEHSRGYDGIKPKPHGLKLLKLGNL